MYKPNYFCRYKTRVLTLPKEWVNPQPLSTPSTNPCLVGRGVTRLSPHSTFDRGSSEYGSKEILPPPWMSRLIPISTPPGTRLENGSNRQRERFITDEPPRLYSAPGETKLHKFVIGNPHRSVSVFFYGDQGRRLTNL